MTADPSPPHEGSRAWVTPVVVFLCVVVLRASFVLSHGVDVPFLDEWRAEGAQVYLPWVHGRLGHADLVAPHNEHRVVFTRLLGLAFFAITGRWSPKLVMFAGTLLPAASAALLVRFGGRAAGRPGLVTAAVVAAAFALPLAVSNLTWAFQSQYGFLTLFSVAALLLAAAPREPGSGRVVAIALACVGAYLSLAGGVATAAVVALCFAARARAPDARRKNAALAAAFLALAVLLRADVPHVPRHDAVAAASAGEALRALATLVAWPHGFGVVVWAVPLVALARFRGLDAERRARVAFPLAVHAWVLAQAVALALGRARLVPHLEANAFHTGRYVELLLPAFAASALLVDALALPGTPATIGKALAFGVLLLQARHNAAVHGADVHSVRSTLQHRVRTAVAAGDGTETPDVRAARLRLLDFDQAPEELLRLLDDPLLRPRLPAGIAPR